MKKIIVLLSILSISVNSWAYSFMVDGIFYQITSASAPYTVAVTYETTSYNSYADDISIPSTVNYSAIDYAVTEIEDYAFSNCTDLTSIDIPSSVTTIGNYVFNQCTGLNDVIIPSSVTYISDYLFYNCSNLASVTIPSSVTSIGWHAFDQCISLSSIDIPSSVTFIGPYAFGNCSNFDTITIPSSVTEIGEGAFSYCNNLASITLPNILISFPKWIFHYCTSLTTVNIPNVTSIGYGAFSNCSNLNTVIIPATITSIDDYAFSNSGLTSINLPSSLTSIGNDAFSYTILSTLNIPSSVTSIEEYAFSGCTYLDTIFANNTTPIDLSFSTDVFYNVNKTSCVLKIPIGSLTAYQAALQWKDFYTMEDDLPNAVNNTTSNTVRVFVENGQAIIHGVALGETITIYNLLGTAIYNQQANTNNIFVNLPTHGMYIVKVGKQSTKVIN